VNPVCLLSLALFTSPISRFRSLILNQFLHRAS
jgi:hypothetical protein